jgi:hypothetical protein
MGRRQYGLWRRAATVLSDAGHGMLGLPVHDALYLQCTSAGRVGAWEA